MSTIRQILALAGVACVLSVSLQAQGAFIDEFDRPDSTDLGTDWTEVVGDWEIYQNRARGLDLTPEKILAHEPMLIDRAFVIEADINWASVRTQWLGIVWNIDGTNTFYVFRMRADTGAVQVLKRVNGGNAANLLNIGGGSMSIAQDVFHRMSIRGDGKGNFWWSVSVVGGEMLGSGSFSGDAAPLPVGPAGLYCGGNDFEVDRFSLESFDLSAEAPDLRIEPAVELLFPTTPGLYYQIESSADLEDWKVEGAPIVGDGLEVSQLFSTRDSDRQFFRVLTSEEP